MSASRTPWRKSRTFGDIHGGRVNRRMTDNIFNRLHSIQRPSLHDILPIVREDNPSRDFVFPASSDMILARLSQLPSDDVAGITHLWLRRWDTSVTDQSPFGEFICGSGVRMIVIYAWPKDLRLRFGKRKSLGQAIARVCAVDDRSPLHRSRVVSHLDTRVAGRLVPKPSFAPRSRSSRGLVPQHVVGGERAADRGTGRRVCCPMVNERANAVDRAR
jgi:hypothetical protein